MKIPRDLKPGDVIVDNHGTRHTVKYVSGLSNECLFCGTRFSAMYDKCPVCAARAEADRLEKLLREIANAGVFITCDTSRGIMARIEAELGA